MSERFEPHDYAEVLISSGRYAHESGVLFRWTGSHLGGAQKCGCGNRRLSVAGPTQS